MITGKMVYEAFSAAAPDASQRDWTDVSVAAKERYEVMAAHLHEHATQGLKARIERHLTDLEREIAEQQARIRETYDSGLHTNVDPQRAAIERYEQRTFALEMVLDEIR